MSFLSEAHWQQPGILNCSSGYGQASSGQQEHPQLQPKPISGVSAAAAMNVSPWNPHSSLLMVPVENDTQSHGKPQLNLIEEKKFGHSEKKQSARLGEATGSQTFKNAEVLREDMSKEDTLRGEKERDGGHTVQSAWVSNTFSTLSPTIAVLTPSSDANCMPHHQNIKCDLKGEHMDDTDGSNSGTTHDAFHSNAKLLTTENTSHREEDNILNRSLTANADTGPGNTDDRKTSLSHRILEGPEEHSAPSTVQSRGSETSCMATIGPPIEAGVTLHPKSTAENAYGGEVYGISITSNSEDGKSEVSFINKDANVFHSPQRSVVRRAMSDCSHLSVPLLGTETYPFGIPSSMPPEHNRTSPAARVPYPHTAVRRSLTVSDSTQSPSAMTNVLVSPSMVPSVLPASPPPKRHQGSCETNVLLPVPSPIGAQMKTPKDPLHTTGKFCKLFHHISIKTLNINLELCKLLSCFFSAW